MALLRLNVCLLNDHITGPELFFDFFGDPSNQVRLKPSSRVEPTARTDFFLTSVRRGGLTQLFRQDSGRVDAPPLTGTVPYRRQFCLPPI